MGNQLLIGIKKYSNGGGVSEIMAKFLYSIGRGLAPVADRQDIVFTYCNLNDVENAGFTCNIILKSTLK